MRTNELGTAVWRGLRASADAQGKGLPIVKLGGDDGDMPLEVGVRLPSVGLVVEEGVSVVLDRSHVRKGGQTQLIADVAERLSHKNRQLYSPKMPSSQGRRRDRVN